MPGGPVKAEDGKVGRPSRKGKWRKEERKRGKKRRSRSI